MAEQKSGVFGRCSDCGQEHEYSITKDGESLSKWGKTYKYRMIKGCYEYPICKDSLACAKRQIANLKQAFEMATSNKEEA